jgi:hypothetical protein
LLAIRGLSLALHRSASVLAGLVLSEAKDLAEWLAGFFALLRMTNVLQRAWGLCVLVRVLYFMMALVSGVAGCSSAPSRVSAPSWNPEGFAEAILAKLDKNGDGSLDKNELAAAPGLVWGAKAIDTDKNGSLSRDELVTRFALYKKMRIGVTSTQLQLTNKGQPIVGAKVTLVPEFFLEGVVEPASGETYQEGYVNPQVPNLDPAGLRVGYYRVVIDAAQAKVPAKYSTAQTTTLGCEVSPVSDANSTGIIQLVLRD